MVQLMAYRVEGLQGITVVAREIFDLRRRALDEAVEIRTQYPECEISLFNTATREKKVWRRGEPIEGG